MLAELNNAPLGGMQAPGTLAKSSIGSNADFALTILKTRRSPGGVDPYRPNQIEHEHQDHEEQEKW
jgi:hypothetical protein